MGAGKPKKQRLWTRFLFQASHFSFWGRGTKEPCLRTCRRWARPCWIVPFFHPFPANAARWPRNRLYLKRLLKRQRLRGSLMSLAW
jgi:hypothetical protein